MNICVYCSSSDAVAAVYFEAARGLGTRMAQRGDTLIYGGANVGLMGAIAQAVKDGAGQVVGVMPEALEAMRITFQHADEFVLTRDMRERKAVMEARADAFVMLPGGFGTLEEVTEVLTLRQLGLHTKPIVIYNVAGFYDPLVALFEHFYHERFAKPWQAMYHVADNVDALFQHLDHHTPETAPSKWLKLGPGEGKE
jgi:cytokinin riboside 5'-monophosphate phosphoribohydrolase